MRHAATIQQYSHVLRNVAKVDHFPVGVYVVSEYDQRFPLPVQFITQVEV